MKPKNLEALYKMDLDVGIALEEKLYTAERLQD